MTLCAFWGCEGAQPDLSRGGPRDQVGAAPHASSYPSRVHGMRASGLCLHTGHPCFKGCSAKYMMAINTAINRVDGFCKEVPKSGKIEFPT